MNFKIVSQIVDYIDEENKYVDDDNISRITGMSAGYARDEFKKVIGLSVDKYRIRRQLSKVIEHAKVTSTKISECDTLPWESTNGFSRAFKKEFKISPAKFLKEYDGRILQMKVDISQKESQYSNLKKQRDYLVRKHSSKAKALLFLLSLEPYQISSIDKMWVESSDIIYESLITSKYVEYAENQREDLYLDNVPNQFYNLICIDF